MTAYSDSSDGAELSVQDFFSHVRRVVDGRLEQFVPSATTSPSTIHSAIRWSLLGAGKRLRPALVMAVGRTFGGLQEDLLDVACAFEMVHTYSLIHDDLPAMDDDDLRRGRPTCHVKFGEASAILAGDALVTFAFETLSRCDAFSADRVVRVIQMISRASGAEVGMIAGQVYDLEG